MEDDQNNSFFWRMARTNREKDDLNNYRKDFQMSRFGHQASTFYCEAMGSIIWMTEEYTPHVGTQQVVHLLSHKMQLLILKCTHQAFMHACGLQAITILDHPSCSLQDFLTVLLCQMHKSKSELTCSPPEMTMS